MTLLRALLYILFGRDPDAEYMVRELANELTPEERAEEAAEERANYERRTSARSIEM